MNVRPNPIAAVIASVAIDFAPNLLAPIATTTHSELVNKDQGVGQANADVQRRAGGVEQLGRLRSLHHEGREEDGEHQHVAEHENPRALLAGNPPGGRFARRCRRGCHGAATNCFSAVCCAPMDRSITYVVVNIQTTTTQPGSDSVATHRLK